MDSTYLGIEIGGTKLQLFLGDENGTIIYRYKTDVGKVKEASYIMNAIEEALKNIILPLGYNIKAIGVGFGGPVDKDRGQICNSYHVNGWKKFEICEWINQIINVPVFLENDANLAALAEAHLGAGKNANLVFYVTIGSGIGGGFIIDKLIYHGKGIAESEIGHFRLTKEGNTFQSECSGWSINAKIRDAIQKFPESKLAQLVNGDTNSEAKYLKQALLNDCQIANQIYSELTDNIAFGLSHVVHLLNPDVIIIGGGVSLIGEMFCRSIEQNIPNYLMDAMLPGPKICLSELKEDVVVVGAILLAIEKYNLNNKHNDGKMDSGVHYFSKIKSGKIPQ